MILAGTPANSAVVMLAPVEAMNTEVVVEVAVAQQHKMDAKQKLAIILILLVPALPLVRERRVPVHARQITIIMKRVMDVVVYALAAIALLLGKMLVVHMNLATQPNGNAKAHGCVRRNG